MFHNPFYAGWVTSERFGIKVGEVRGNWEPIVTTEQFHRGIHILHKHDNEKSRMKKHFYLLRGLLWVQAKGKRLKMYGSTPSGCTQNYSYYISHANIGDKNLHISCSVIDNQIPQCLQGVSVNPELIPSIREVYRSEIDQATTKKDKGERLIELRKQATKMKEEEKRLGRLYITGKITEDAYEQLHSEWQEKLRNIELTLAEMEREPTIHINDLDIALVLLTKISQLYSRLDKNQKSTLLQILAKQIIVNGNGEIIDFKLNSPFLYLRSVVDYFFTPSNREGCSSEQINVGAPTSQKPPTSDVERFLSMLRFDSKENLGDLRLEFDFFPSVKKK